MSQQYDPCTDPGFGYSCLCGDYNSGTVPERIICAACKVEEQKHQLATLTQERDALKRIIDDTLREVPVGNVNAHIPENLPRDMEYYVQETVKQDFEIERLEKERDALREVVRALIRAGDALYIRGKFADPDYWASCNWATVVEESANLLPPSGEAGKGGGA